MNSLYWLILRHLWNSHLPRKIFVRPLKALVFIFLHWISMFSTSWLSKDGDCCDIHSSTLVWHTSLSYCKHAKLLEKQLLKVPYLSMMMLNGVWSQPCSPGSGHKWTRQWRSERTKPGTNPKHRHPRVTSTPMRWCQTRNRIFYYVHPDSCCDLVNAYWFTSVRNISVDVNYVKSI